MSQGGGDDLIRIEAKRASDLRPDFTPSDEAGALLTDGLSPSGFLSALIDSALFTDAEVFLAFALPRRESVWWASQCVRLAVGPEAPPPIAEALTAAERWAASPGDVNRRKTFPAAEAAGFDHPAGCVALAAFFSGGSLGPPDLKEIPPARDLAPRTASAAIQMAAVLSEPERASEKHRQFLDLGLAVARGTHRWKDNL